MSIKSFGATREGREAVLITLKNKNGASVSITDFGGAIVSMCMPDKNGGFTDVVLGYTDVKYYEENGGHLGAIVGRVGNRISDATYKLNGVTYQLVKNNGRHNLHSGPDYYEDRFWNYAIDEAEDKVSFTLDSPDMDQGYPGEARIRVTYTLLADNALRIQYHAICDRDTLINMTNHSYFNLNGEGDILDHVVTIHAQAITGNDDGGCPDGVIIPVGGTVFDFNTPHAVGERIDTPDKQLEMAGGYDHNYVLDEPDRFRPVALVYGPKSGITMEVETDTVGMQLYTGNSMGYPGGKNGAFYESQAGLCLETQGFPNSINIPSFPSIVLRAGEEYATTTVYSFKTE